MERCIYILEVVILKDSFQITCEVIFLNQYNFLFLKSIYFRSCHLYIFNY